MTKKKIIKFYIPKTHTEMIYNRGEYKEGVPIIERPSTKMTKEERAERFQQLHKIALETVKNFKPINIHKNPCKWCSTEKVRPSGICPKCGRF